MRSLLIQVLFPQNRNGIFNFGGPVLLEIAGISSYFSGEL